jgi:hypothetical protein
MKTFSWTQAQGLAWFFLVYALSRLTLSMPDLGNQSPESFGIFFSAMTLAWMVYSWQKSSRSLAFLTTNLFVVSAFIFIYFGHFGKVEIMVALGVIGGLSFSYFLYSLAQSIKGLLKKQENMLWPMVIQLLATIIFIVVLEYYWLTIQGLGL